MFELVFSLVCGVGRKRLFYGVMFFFSSHLLQYCLKCYFEDESMSIDVMFQGRTSGWIRCCQGPQLETQCIKITWALG